MHARGDELCQCGSRNRSLVTFHGASHGSWSELLCSDDESLRLDLRLCARSARRNFVIPYCICDQISPSNYTKWSNFAVKYLWSKVVKFTPRIKILLPDYARDTGRVAVGRGRRERPGDSGDGTANGGTGTCNVVGTELRRPRAAKAEST